MKWISIVSLIFTILTLAGCSSIVKDNLHYPNSFHLEISGATDSELQEWHNLEAKELILDKEQTLSYLWGDSTKITESYSPPTLTFKAFFKNAPYNVPSVRFHNYNADFRNKPQTSPQGLVVLLHSYGTSSTSLLYDSTAFQVKGYQTAIVDLLGHGKNNSLPASFGPKDIEYLHLLITHLQKDSDLPIFLYGKSYGASIAAQYIEAYGNIDGFIAIAPMTHFTKAAVELSNSINPFLKILINDEWLGNEVEKTLNTSQVSSEQISTPNILRRLSDNSLPPTLLFTSSTDKISNHEDVSKLADLNKITFIDVPDHKHVEMMIFDDTFDHYINDWLNSNF
ncbi:MULTISPECIES: alpha/beta hydrolase [Idiomarina]|uniref:alpha/beta hydrolase n=1 Tax=Idiomarina TaxID=135575 RepID=UPI00241E204D|nr:MULTISPECIES: alpha/beta fold hydrolase [Idiomarina]